MRKIEMIWPDAEVKVDGKTHLLTECVNYFPTGDGGVKRIGYSSFLGLMWEMFKVNRACRKVGFKTRIDITMPIKWW